MISRVELFGPKIQRKFLYVSVFMLPFSSIPFLHGLIGEASGEGSLVPLFLGLFCFTLHYVLVGSSSGKVVIGNGFNFRLAFVFFAAVGMSFLINYSQIISNDYMGKSGLFRFNTQLILMLFALSVCFMISVQLKSESDIQAVFSVSRIGFVFVLLFAFFQYIAYYYQGGALALFYKVGSIIYEDGVIDFALSSREGYGLHSVSQEPSHLAMYIAVIFPFVISGLSKRKQLAMCFVCGLLVVLTWSRTAYVVFLVQMLLLFYLSKFNYFSVKKAAPFICLVLFCVSPFFVFDMFIGDLIVSIFDVENNGSSSARLGAAYSAVRLWLDGHVLFGVGLGQAGYFLMDYLPDWAFLSGDTYDVFNGLRWPPIHNLLVRVLVEVGLLGFAVFISLFAVLFYQVNRVIKIKYLMDKRSDAIGIALLVSLVSSVLAMMNREVISNMNIWVSVGMSMAYISISNQKVKVYRKLIFKC